MGADWHDRRGAIVCHAITEAAWRLSGLTAPWLIDGTIDRTAFDLYIETQLAPCNQVRSSSSTTSRFINRPGSAGALRARGGAWFLFLHPTHPT